MRIFDNRWQGPHGIGRFSGELYRRLPGFSPIALEGSPARAFDAVFLEHYLRRTKPRFYFSPGYNVPLTRKVPFAFCLHDLNHLAEDESRSYRKQKYYEWIVRPAVSRARVVFTVSEFSRTEICEWANIDCERVVNVGNGVSEVFRKEGDAYRFGEYFVHVGGERPHKNLRGVMQALSTAKRLSMANLVCVGGKVREIMKLAGEYGLTERTRALRDMSDESLAGVYRGAIGLVFVSMREGFGLPIVEAMACGCPVITSRLSSMPEVSGGAALLVDPKDPESIAEGMESIACAGAVREKLSAMGKVRSLCFTWNATASAVLSELEKCNY